MSHFCSQYFIFTMYEHFCPVSVRVELGPIPADTGRGAGCILDMLAVHHMAERQIIISHPQPIHDDHLRRLCVVVSTGHEPKAHNCTSIFIILVTSQALSQFTAEKLFVCFCYFPHFSSLLHLFSVSQHVFLPWRWEVKFWDQKTCLCVCRGNLWSFQNAWPKFVFKMLDLAKGFELLCFFLSF